MPQKRNSENRGLPNRWRFYHGAYRYHRPFGQEHTWDGKRQFTLGRTLGEAYKVWAERVAWAGSTTLVKDLLERYAREVIPRKAPRTQLAHAKIIPTLTRAFGHARVRGDVKPHHVYE